MDASSTAPQDPEVSPVEELDQQLPCETRPAYRRESLLGLVLLLAVLAWAGWQWWEQEALRGSYTRARQAEVKQDWDAALALYKAANGYSDADARVDQVAKIVAERDRHYEEGVAHAARGEWVASYRALREVQRLQPDYPGLVRMMPEVESGVRGEALLSISGTVALRREADPPGLYLRLPGRWAWLPGSDQWSLAHNVSGRHILDSSRHIIYDAPGPGWSPAARIPATSREPQLSGRRLMAASVAASDYSFTSSPLDLDPSLYMFYRTGLDGIWAFRQRAHEPDQQDAPQSYYWTWNVEIAYQAFISATGAPRGAVTSTITLPGPEWVVVELFDHTGQVLLAEVSEGEGGSLGPLSRLYIADADGTNRRPVYTVAGFLRSAQLSPDGRYLLMMIEMPMGSEPGSRRPAWLWKRFLHILLDVAERSGDDGNTAADRDHTLADVFVQDDTSQPYMGGVFISSGPFAGKLLLSEWGNRGPGAGTGDRLTLRILDPATTDELLRITFRDDFMHYGGALGLLWTPDTADEGHRAAENSAASVMVVGRGWGGPPLSNNPLSVLSIPDQLATSGGTVIDGASRLVELPLSEGEQIIDLLLSPGYTPTGDDYLAYLGVNDREVPVSFSLYSLPLSELTAPQTERPKPRLVYRGEAETSDSRLDEPRNILSWRMRRGWLAYTSSGELHARTYDGSVDLGLEQGVARLYDFDRHDNWQLIR